MLHLDLTYVFKRTSPRIMFKVSGPLSIRIFPTGSFIEYLRCSTARMEEITIYPLKE